MMAKKKLTMESIKRYLDGSTILITGGTGSFGRALTERILSISENAKIVIYSRDEYKQYLMKQDFREAVARNQLSFIIGDVRDWNRLIMACRSVDFIFHAAALKQVPTCEENIEECILTNINGAVNVRFAAEMSKVKKVVALSTDKAVQPVNLYGATKMVSDKVFTDMSATSETVFCIVRYGNVASSRGSVIPFFQKIKNKGTHLYPVTDPKMTRFWSSLSEAVSLALTALCDSSGGETYIAKLPSFRIIDLISAIDSQGQMDVVGIRPSEKLHEIMITQYDAPKTMDYGTYFVIYPTPELAHIGPGMQVPDMYSYSSDTNDDWLTVEEIRKKLE